MPRRYEEWVLLERSMLETHPTFLCVAAKFFHSTASKAVEEVQVLRGVAQSCGRAVIMKIRPVTYMEKDSSSSGSRWIAGEDSWRYAANR